MKNENTYKEGFCHKNVVCLGKQLRDGGLNSQHLKVWIIRAKDQSRRALSVGLGTRTPEEWAYHALLEYKGTIFDYESPEAGHPIDLKQYLDRHFPHRLIYNNELVVNEFKFDDYEKWSEANDPHFWQKIVYKKSFQLGNLDQAAIQRGIQRDVAPPNTIDRFRSWKFGIRAKLASSGTSGVIQYLNQKSLGDSVSLSVWDSKKEEFATVRGRLLEREDNYCVLQDSQGIEIFIPYNQVDYTYLKYKK